MPGIKVKEHERSKSYVLLEMMDGDKEIGSQPTEIIDGKLNKVPSDFSSTKQVDGEYFTFTAVHLNVAVDKYNAGELKFGDILEL
jgi:hypothetical protein